MATTMIMNSPKMSSTSWDKSQSIATSSNHHQDILFEPELSPTAEEASEASLHEDEFEVLRAADPEVAEKFQNSVGKLYRRSKSPASRKIQSAELVPQFSKSSSQVAPEDPDETNSSNVSSSKQREIADAFDSPTFVKPTLQSTITKEDVFNSPKYKSKDQTSFYGSERDVFASPGSTNGDSSSCTTGSAKDDTAFSSPSTAAGPKPKQKNLVRNVAPRSLPANTKRVSPTAKKTTLPKEGNVTPGKRRASTPKTPKPKLRSLNLDGSETPTVALPLTDKQEQRIKEKLLRSVLSHAGQRKIKSSQRISTILTPADLDAVVGNITPSRQRPTTNLDLLDKLEQHDKTAPLPFARSDEANTVTTSTSSKSASSKTKSPTKVKRIIKIRKSDFDASEQGTKANLDDLLDKAAHEWKTTLRKSTVSSGKKCQADPSANSSAPSVTNKTRQPSRKGAETSGVKAEPGQSEPNRDASRGRSRRTSPRSYEQLDSGDDSAPNDQSAKTYNTRSQSKSRRGSRTTATQLSPERRPSIFNELKALASPAARKTEKSSRSYRTTGDARRPSLMASVAKKFGSERKERSLSMPRATNAASKSEKMTTSPRSVSNPRSSRTIGSDDLKRENTAGPFSLHGLQKMLGFSPTSTAKEKVKMETTLSDHIERPKRDAKYVEQLLARMRKAGVTDEILLALSEQGLVIVERKARI